MVSRWSPSLASAGSPSVAEKISRQAGSAGAGSGGPEEGGADGNGTRRGLYAYLDVYLRRNGPLDAQYRVSVSTARR